MDQPAHENAPNVTYMVPPIPPQVRAAMDFCEIISDRLVDDDVLSRPEEATYNAALGMLKQFFLGEMNFGFVEINCVEPDDPPAAPPTAPPAPSPVKR